MKMHDLQTYLTDHLAGAGYALELLEECREQYPDLRPVFDRLLVEIEADRDILEALLLRMDGTRSRIKEAGARTLQKLSRIKHSEPSESAATSLLERLETLALGVLAKRSLWEALAAVSTEGRFGGLDLAVMTSRAQGQYDEIVRQRRRAARRAFLGNPGSLLVPSRGAHERPGEHTELRGVLLDLDGTLIDTNDAHARAWVAAFAEMDRPVRFERVRPLIGMGGDKLIPAVTDIDPRSEPGRAIARRQTEIFLERHLGACRPFPRVRELLEKMRSEGLGLAVATSAGEKELERIVDAADIDDLIQTATSASDVEDSKPEGDVVEAALARTGWAADETLLLGDTPFDVSAGEDAGVDVVTVRCGGSSDAELAGSLAIYADPTQLLAEYGASPFARRRDVRRRDPAPTGPAGTRSRRTRWARGD